MLELIKGPGQANVVIVAFCLVWTCFGGFTRNRRKSGNGQCHQTLCCQQRDPWIHLSNQVKQWIASGRR